MSRVVVYLDIFIVAIALHTRGRVSVTSRSLSPVREDNEILRFD